MHVTWDLVFECVLTLYKGLKLCVSQDVCRDHWAEIIEWAMSPSEMES